VPVELARRAFEAAGSRDKELKIFTLEEGGAEHCQLDIPSMATDYIYPWILKKLNVSPAGAK
jgi:hypothetical protein